MSFKVFISTEQYNNKLYSLTLDSRRIKRYIYISGNSGSAWLDETNGVPETKARAVTLETGIGAKTAAQSQEIPPTGQSWYYQFPETWWMVLEAWYFRQAGMVWSWGPRYTRLGGTNMVQTINCCQGDE